MKKVFVLIGILFLVLGCNQKETVISHQVFYDEILLTGKIYDEHLDESDGLYYLSVVFSYFEYVVDLVDYEDISLFGLYYLNNNVNEFVEVDYHLLEMIKWQTEITPEIGDSVFIDETQNMVKITEKISLDDVKYHYAFYVMNGILADFGVEQALIGGNGQINTGPEDGKDYKVKVVVDDSVDEMVTVLNRKYLYRVEFESYVVLLVDSSHRKVANAHFSLVNNESENMESLLNDLTLDDFYVFEK